MMRKCYSVHVRRSPIDENNDYCKQKLDSLPPQNCMDIPEAKVVFAAAKYLAQILAHTL